MRVMIRYLTMNILNTHDIALSSGKYVVLFSLLETNLARLVDRL